MKITNKMVNKYLHKYVCDTNTEREMGCYLQERRKGSGPSGNLREEESITRRNYECYLSLGKKMRMGLLI